LSIDLLKFGIYDETPRVLSSFLGGVGGTRRADSSSKIFSMNPEFDYSFGLCAAAEGRLFVRRSVKCAWGRRPWLPRGWQMGIRRTSPSARFVLLLPVSLAPRRLFMCCFFVRSH
jgi:hypothetical protein